MKRLPAWLAFAAPLLAAAFARAEDVAASAAGAVEAERVAKPFLEGLWDLMGVAHPAIVHFPIGLVVGAAMFIVARCLIFKKMPIEVPYYALMFGALFAIPATIFGISYAEGLGMGGAFGDKAFDPGASAFWHRWGGVGVCVLSIVVAFIACKSMAKPEKSQVKWQVLVLFTAAVMGWVGSEGGELTYGEDHYDVWHVKQAPVIDVAPPPDDGKVDFVKHIQPILEATCISCHGPDEDKGDYRMHTKADFFKGGTLAVDEGLMPVVAGNVDPFESNMLYLLEPDDEDELMPPKKEGGPLTSEQIQLIKDWVEQGANWPDGVVLKDTSESE